MSVEQIQDTSYRLNVFEKRVAFTLAETLITLAIIGVVAAITIPSLVKNYNEKAWSTAQDVFTKRLEVATRQMNTEEKLAGYSSTMDFVNELKKYIKITRVCDNKNITKCFNKEVIWSADEEPVDMSKVTDASAFGLDWETDTVAVQFANGVNAVIAYNPNATQDPFNNQFSATSNSMAILYDVTGNKNPNKYGAPLTKAECEAQKGDLGISSCFYNNDYWAGAVKACGGINNMPTESQLIDLAKYVYNTDSINGGTSMTRGLTLDTTKASQFLSASPGSGKFCVWSGQEDNSAHAYIRYFYSTDTFWDFNGGRGNGGIKLAVCVDH